MSSAQKRCANTIIAFFLFWPFFDFVTQREDYPFAAYTMYSSVMKSFDYSNYYVAFVDANGQEHSVQPWNSKALDEARLLTDLKKKLKLSTDGTLARKVLRHLLNVAEQATRNTPKTPHVVGVRLYQQKWAQLKHDKVRRPDHKELIIEERVGGSVE